jgi:uncharacterized protein with FMN-binding domain
MSKLKNKLIFSWLVVGGFIIYSILQGLGRLTGRSASLAESQPLNNPIVNSKTLITKQTAKTVPAKYHDGVYTGRSADAYYGNVQVQVTIKTGQIAAVQFLDYPHDQENSRNINSAAMPTLKSEALAAQSAQIDTVSGATETSQAFIESLKSALSQA